MFRSKVMPFVLTAMLTASVACSDDKKDDDGGTGPSGDQLTTVEFESMVEALGVLNSLGIGGLIAFDQPSSPALAAQTGTQTYTATEQCPNGGTTAVTGTYTVSVSGQSYTGNYTITQSYSNCRAASDNGTIWTFNGNPNLGMNINYTYSETGAFQMTGTQTGGFSWSGSGKSGGCQVNTNLNYSANVSGQSYTYTYSYTGSVCGQTVNESGTFTA